MTVSRWGLTEYREALVTLMSYRKMLEDKPLPDDKPERLRRLDFMITDVAVHITELLNRETDNGEAEDSGGA